MKMLMFAAAATAMTMAAPVAAAPVIDNTVTCAGTGLSCSRSSAIMDSGVEFVSKLSGMSLLGFDFSDGLLTMSNPLGSGYGIVGDVSFRFSNGAGGFGQATLVSNTGFAGLSQANFTVADGVLTFASSTFSADRGASLTLNLGSAGAVPEPASWAMMMLGFGMMGYALRRHGAAPAAVTA